MTACAASRRAAGVASQLAGGRSAATMVAVVAACGHICTTTHALGLVNAMQQSYVARDMGLSAV